MWVISSSWTSSGGILRFYLGCYLRIGASGLIGHRGPKLWDSKEAAETPDTFPCRHDGDGWWGCQIFLPAFWFPPMWFFKHHILVTPKSVSHSELREPPPRHRLQKMVARMTRAMMRRRWWHDACCLYTCIVSYVSYGPGGYVWWVADDGMMPAACAASKYRSGKKWRLGDTVTLACLLTPLQSGANRRVPTKSRPRAAVVRKAKLQLFSVAKSVLLFLCLDVSMSQLV